MTTLARATGTWRKSSRSNNGNDACVELACTTELGADRRIRDSKNPGGPVLCFSEEATGAFIAWAVATH
jgi:hypothetical protein